jgi:hypothetical protein
MSISLPALTLFAQLLAPLLKEAAHRAGKRRDDGDRPDLHEHIEHAPARRDRILDLRGDGQQLCASPKEGAAKGFDLCFLRVPLDEVSQNSADQVDSNGRHSDRREMVSEAPVCVCSGPRYVVGLPDGRTQDPVRHQLTIARVPDATIVGR